MVEDVHYVQNRSNINDESQIDTERYAKCPRDDDIGQYLDHRYEKRSSDRWELTLRDIKDENNITGIYRDLKFFNESKYESSANYKPALWTKSVTQFRLSCQ